MSLLVTILGISFVLFFIYIFITDYLQIGRYKIIIEKDDNVVVISNVRMSAIDVIHMYNEYTEMFPEHKVIIEKED